MRVENFKKNTLIVNYQLSIVNYFAIFAKCIGSVVQWIEFKIPVLTIAVRIRSESLTNGKLKAEN